MKYMIVDTKTNNAIFREGGESLFDGIREFGWNDSNAIIFEQKNKRWEQTRINDITRKGLNICIDTAMKNAFGDLHDLNDYELIAAQIAEDVMESSDFEHGNWNTVDIQAAMRRVFNRRTPIDIYDIGEAICDVTWNAMDEVIRGDINIQDHARWDLFELYHNIIKIALDAEKMYQDMTEEERDAQCGWLEIIGNYSRVKIREAYADIIDDLRNGRKGY